MDINQLDIELNTKVKETFKIVLKKSEVDIVFEIPNYDENITEITTIKQDNHNFILLKKIENVELMNLNEKYYPLISNNLIDKLKNLTMDDRRKLLNKKTWYFLFLVPIFGKKYNISSETVTTYYLNYNSVIINLTKFEYDRFLYYTKYVYKLQQLHKLNDELDIQQEFNIIFDDDKAVTNLYKDMYENFKGLIGPTNDNDNDENYPDVDDDDI